MSLTLGTLLRPLVGVSDHQVSSFRKGDGPAWHALERAVRAAIAGYHATLDDSRLEVLVPRLEQIEAEVRGYAYEGAAMGLTGLDCMLPGSNRLQAFLDGAGSAHIYMVHIGAGEALARLRRRPERTLARLDPVLRWLVMDGYGFHEGFFAERRTIEGQAIPAHLSPYARRVFDQGLGRAIWFLRGADVGLVSETVAAFPPARHADLWSGVGVACSYAGGTGRGELGALQALAGDYTAHLAMGVAVVAKGRHRAGNPAPHSDLACEVLCGLSSPATAVVVDEAFANLPLDTDTPPYATLQQRLVNWFAAHQTEEVRL